MSHGHHHTPISGYALGLAVSHPTRRASANSAQSVAHSPRVRPAAGDSRPATRRHVAEVAMPR
jgi:hypothetical protein